MQNIFAIWQRELKAYFVSPIAYVVLTVFTFLSGFFFFAILANVVQNTMMQQGPQSQPVDVPEDQKRVTMPASPTSFSRRTSATSRRLRSRPR